MYIQVKVGYFSFISIVNNIILKCIYKEVIELQAVDGVVNNITLKCIYKRTKKRCHLLLVVNNINSKYIYKKENYVF